MNPNEVLYLDKGVLQYMSNVIKRFRIAKMNLLLKITIRKIAIFLYENKYEIFETNKLF